MKPSNKIVKKFFYDVETTGLNPNRHSIHQLSFYIEIDGVVVEKHDLKLRPHPKAEVTQEAMTLCKVTKEQVQAYPEFESQFKVLKKILCKYIDTYDIHDNFYLIGFKNASFDDEFIKKLFELCGDKFFLYFFASPIDVSCLAAEYLINRRYRMINFKLLRVARELGIVVDENLTHEASYDVELTRQVYRIVTGREQESLM